MTDETDINRVKAKLRSMMALYSQTQDDANEYRILLHNARDLLSMKPHHTKSFITTACSIDCPGCEYKVQKQRFLKELERVL